LRGEEGHEGNAVPTDWSSTADALIYHSLSTATGFDLWRLPIRGGGKPAPVLRGAANEIQGALSPDGRWLAYSSDESGRFEVYVQTYPPSERKWIISTKGGSEPRWSREGRELYFLDADRNLVAVLMAEGAALRTGAPHRLFETHTSGVVGPYRRHYDVLPNGKGFLVSSSLEPAPSPVITVTTSWLSTLHQ
jgi:Tol biopolymer transport system component